jgi:cytochrome b subunit of formate dehydrogenase
MNDSRRYLRFPFIERIEHWVVVLSFVVLAVTGLVQRYALVTISQRIIALLGGIENVRIFHRVASIVLMIEAVYHVGTLIYKLLVLRVRPTIIPGITDLRNVFRSLSYNLNLSDVRPQQGRYTFEEKAEYWFMIWGTIIMGATGFMMWNPIATARLLPGEFIPAAKAAHSGEALLAVMSIIVWHLYHVHIRSFNKSMFTGHMSEEEMIHDHPLELADLKAGIAHRATDPVAISRRRRIFLPLYLLAGTGMIFAIYFFTTFEQTAITTIPPAEDVVVYAPLWPTAIPTATTAADAPHSWDDGFADLLEQRCGTCHSSVSAFGGLDLSSYASMLAGGASGPAIIPGDSPASLLITRQATGDHPGQLSGEELALISQWIDAGAPKE